MTNVGIIKCEVTDAYNGICPGRGCFAAVQAKDGQFESYDDVTVRAFGNCGGCPGRNVGKIAKIMKDECDVEVVHLSSCTHFGDPICPYLDVMKKAISDNGLKVVMGTHSRKRCVDKKVAN